MRLMLFIVSWLIFSSCAAPVADVRPVDPVPVQPISAPASTGAALVLPASKAATPPAKSLPAIDASCKKDSDCVNSPYVLQISTCCSYPHCEMNAGNTAWAEEVKQLCEGPMKRDESTCPLVDCQVAKTPICRKGTCTFR